jgi:hypothetical protein
LMFFLLLIMSMNVPTGKHYQNDFLIIVI